MSWSTCLDGRVMFRHADVVWRFLPDQWLFMNSRAQSATQGNIIGQQQQQTAEEDEALALKQFHSLENDK